MPRSGLREFNAVELRAFLTAIDAHLSKHARMIIIGGSAVAVAYGVDTGTIDVDTWETDLRPIARAITAARHDTGLDIPVSDASVGDVPWKYEERIVRILPELSRLAVFALEKHDLTLSKTVRGYENDLVAIEGLHQRHGLDLDTLVARWADEMDHAIGDRKRLDLNFQLMIERIFGEMEAERVRRGLRGRRTTHD